MSYSRIIPTAKPVQFRVVLPITSRNAEPVDRYCITDQIPDLDKVRPEKKCVLIAHLTDQLGYSPKVILAVIGTYGQHRSVPRDSVAGSRKCVEFRPFDVHLYISGRDVTE